jgi:uncharacterized protein YrzB (UPF0473 family)
MEPAEEFAPQLISMTGEDGQPHLYRIFNLFPFEGQEYALLAEVNEPQTGDISAGPATLMRLVEQGDQALFQPIQSDEEFARVKAFVQALAREMDEADG